MQQTWRWFGPSDPVSLSDIRQAGASGVVTALHEVPNDQVWPVEAILERKQKIEAAGLSWAVVESIPVHEDIKTGAAGWQDHARNWAQSMHNLAECGIKRICYNFMPVIDWTRTELDHVLPDGATCLRFDYVRLAAFDLFILERTGAEADYSVEVINLAREAYQAMTQEDRDVLTATIIAGLPGSEESYTIETFRKKLALYNGTDTDVLRSRLADFLGVIVPEAEKCGALLAIHPDDPPFPLFGLPRVVSTVEDMVAIAAMQDSLCNGFTFCTGSYGVREDNDLPAMLRKFSSRIHFAHLRSTKRSADGRSFRESAHLDGDLDMVSVITELLREEQRRDELIPFRPDHGHRILDDLRHKTTPGYPAIGRLRGLAELRGIECAVRAFLK